MQCGAGLIHSERKYTMTTILMGLLRMACCLGALDAHGVARRDSRVPTRTGRYLTPESFGW